MTRSEKKIDAQFVDEDLIDLVKKGKFKDIYLQIELGADIEVIEADSGNNLLHIAIIHNQPQIIAPLCRLGIDINRQNFSETSPFELALCLRAFDCAQILFDYHCDIRAIKSCFEKNLLKNSHVEIQKFLTNLFSKKSLADRDYKLAVEKDQQFRLLRAIKNNNIGAVKKLVLEEGVNINFISDQGENPLCCAIENKLKDVVKFLFEPKNQISFCRSLLAAIKSGKSFIIDDLIEFNVRLDCHFGQKNVFCQVLENAKSIKEAKNFLNYFVEKGVDINLKNINAETVLMFACKNEYGYLIDDLIKLGADPYLKNRIECTAFDMALVAKDNFAIKKLLQNGYKIGESNVEMIFYFAEKFSKEAWIDDFFKLLNTDYKFLILSEAIKRNNEEIFQKVLNIDEVETLETLELIARLKKHYSTIAQKIMIEKQFKKTQNSERGL